MLNAVYVMLVSNMDEKERRRFDVALRGDDRPDPRTHAADLAKIMGAF